MVEQGLKECDLVMKGGITSGVIYPGAIDTLSRHYRFRSIGGASAGAIAAATAAAAEYARQTKGSRDGFDKLAELPKRLGEVRPSGRTRLASLFQPTVATATAFDGVLIAMSNRDGFGKATALLQLITRGCMLPVLVAIALAAGVFCVGCSAGGIGVAFGLVGAIAVLVLGFVGAVACIGLRTYRSVTSNFGGLCRGYGATHVGDDPPLITWLTETIHEVAGVKTPLTFGQLQGKGIDLVMMTTNLTHGRPHRVPFKTELLFFREDEMATLFPPEIVDALVQGGRSALDRPNTSGEERNRWSLKQIAAANPGFIPLPDHDDLPVAFAVRLSLSFPVLLSAVPLYTVDFSLPVKERALQRCWFSDGGICSNLPVHFFDQLLPKRPTFALNLRPAAEKLPESKLVFLANNNIDGVAEQWNHITGDGLPIASLIGTMIETMQCWNDNVMLHAPGFRDRVVHISHTTKEGGLNLEMPGEMIEGLSKRGALAGQKIIDRFVNKPDGWDNHLWVRYRTTLGVLQPLLSQTYKEYFSTAAARAPIDRLIASPTGYKMSGKERDAAMAVNDVIAKFGTISRESFEVKAPRPRLVLRPRPRDS